MKLSISSIRFSSISILFIFYALSAILSIRGEYRPGDELGFLTASSDRNAQESFDRSCFLWTAYIGSASIVHLVLPLLIDILLPFVLLSISIKQKPYTRSVVLQMLLLPTVF